MENKIEIQELSLLVWLSRGSKKKLIELMCEYSGCKEEDYSDKELRTLMQHCIQDITQKYHILGLWWEYFNAQNRWQDYAEMFPNKYTYSELDALSAVILSIKPSVFDEEDKVRIEELRKKYVHTNNEQGGF